MISDSFIPFEKSWLIRMGILDIINGRNQVVRWLEAQPEGILGTDLEALLRAAKSWQKNGLIEVGESGTLYRFLQFASWKLGMGLELKKEGTLKVRRITEDPSIINLSLEELEKLDAGTSQWASAAVLLGEDYAGARGSLPYHFRMTLEAKAHWQQRTAAGLDWLPRRDQTIARQAAAYQDYLESGQMTFLPIQAEDYCFARAFGLISATEGEGRWPSLRQHESDRIAEMEAMLSREVVDSHDHRVVQAIAMAKGSAITFSHPESVSKTWPQFWAYLRSQKV